MREGGFDAIIGNPPYVASRNVTGYSIKGCASHIYETENCPDLYAWCLERVTEIASKNARTGMIVPLSFSFSGKFDAIRNLLYSRYRQNWFSHFGRIPAALFAADVRVRNTIHIGSLSGRTNKQYTARLHRWFQSFRPYLLSTLSYASYSPDNWQGRIPKLNTQNLIDAFQRLTQPTSNAMGLSISQSMTKHQLHFKKTAYNWLSFSHQQAPCFDVDGGETNQTNCGTICFESKEMCDLAFLLLNGKIEYSFWVALGDDFSVARGMFFDLPLSPSFLTEKAQKELLTFVPALKKAVKEAVQFKLNAGWHVGNYNLAKCRHITDKTDAILAKHFGLDAVWDDIELLYVQTVKTDFSGDEGKE